MSPWNPSGPCRGGGHSHTGGKGRQPTPAGPRHSSPVPSAQHRARPSACSTLPLTVPSPQQWAHGGQPGTKLLRERRHGPGRDLPGRSGSCVGRAPRSPGGFLSQWTVRGSFRAGAEAILVTVTPKNVIFAKMANRATRISSLSLKWRGELKDPETLWAAAREESARDPSEGGAVLALDPMSSRRRGPSRRPEPKRVCGFVRGAGPG